MVLRVIFLIIVFFSLIVPPCLLAAEPPANAETAVAVETPGLSELGARVSALNDFIAASEERLIQLSELAGQHEALNEIAQQFTQVNGEMQLFGPPEDWYVDRLNHFLNRFSQLQQNLASLQQRLTMRQQETEKIRTQLQKNLDFWSGWEKDLKKQDVNLPKQTISEAKQQLAELQKKLKKTSDLLLLLQEKIGVSQREVMPVIDRLTTALSKLRQATFRRNAYSFFSAEYYQQFSADLGLQVKEGAKAALKIDRHYLQDNGWRLGFLAGTMALVAWGLLYFRRRHTATEDWHFILRRPLAAAGFVTVSLSWLWLPTPPALLHFALVCFAVLTAVALAMSLLENRRQVRFLMMAALVFLLTNLFLLISFPQPLFRIYILALAVIFVPVLSRQVGESRQRCASGQGRFYRMLLRIAILVLCLSFFGQLAGLMNFSTWLIQATFETGVVVLFARMVVRLLSGGIELTNDTLAQSKLAFFQEYGAELGARLKRLITFFVYGFSVFYLLPVWRLFATLNEGWQFFSDLSIEIGSFALTAQMFGSALIAFYLAMQVSWVLQAATETQVLRRKNADRGVQDAVKKLIHYAIVLIGFLLALSMLGLGVQNFVVLLSAFGVGIGFGLQDIVNNFLSGLILLFERPIKVGDGVVIDGEYGTVMRIGMRSTVVQNLDEAELIVPNSQMISQKVTNWTLTNRRVRIVVPVGVAYGSDLEKVLAILEEAGQSHPEVLGFPKPTPFFVQFGASSLDFELRVWIANVDNRPRIKNELLLYIDKRFREEKIEIPFSQHDLHIRSVSPGVLPGAPVEATEE
ncbi:Mechanosensitive ion channel [Malonomonas rubra DSM 5091]|uniref:Mechanosensitive ion channel n=1 Tax=Malonomonas rubra DSM 5091 TaxID=1122189 RepID=A0A1M6GFW4_MALRU|nr:mechanosensitive ion channel domain-containing protein [Malonomonas rubra]SHJ08822.1 Mechanosensitive ion channel [Malonomonas rubra DSM 5091]